MTRRVALAVNPQRDEAERIASSLGEWLRSEGAEVLWGWGDGEQAASVRPDLVVAVGGDGTVLQAVRALHGDPVPVIGVNAGMLGYLTQVQPAGARAALEAWLTGEPGRDWWIDQRGLLEVKVMRGGARAPEPGDAMNGCLLCLNEVVLDRHESGRTVRLRVDIDGQDFATYSADGVIVSTPTGSTAYSLSARGPVLSPKVEAILVTPVSPHMLFDRSLVLSWEERVTLTVDAARPARLALDGVGLGLLEEGDVVTVTGSDKSAHFVRSDDTPFHRVLREKFGLGDR